ncbi:MAG: proline--tRNA ligase [Bdellovibrionaceae bacterium]|nr:proline--tRNA ligase [Pseudobdellovibrionaceae bacterium]MDW8190000.1 proline--tRNA ligase [Pseudobdellovibrionaceae bacterium]
MRWTQTFLYTQKENPSDADIVSQSLFVRAGFIKKLSSGIYYYSPLMLRAIRKLEAIIREEHEKIGAIEIMMPILHPRPLWEETGRWEEMGPGLLKLKNRNDHWFCLGATHEEACVDYVRNDLRSWRDLPKIIYQIQTKFRDEIRPRFGLLRGREFIMKDAYSFHATAEDAQKTYWLMYKTYQKIFNRLGITYRVVQADSGNIGGAINHEFQLLASAGEDALLVSEGSDFAANIEICEALPIGPEIQEPQKQLEKIHTPGVRTIQQLSDFLKLPPSRLVKTLFIHSEGVASTENTAQTFAILIRGDHELNLVKVKNYLGLSNPPRLLEDHEVTKVCGANPGSCGPIGLEIPILVDRSVAQMTNLIVGANQDDWHVINVNMYRDFTPHHIGDFRMAQEGDPDPTHPQYKLRSYRGIEVGHVFYLGTKYSEKMHLYYTTPEGHQKPVEMGCYGIGVTRTLQAIIEQSHDQDGMIWPIAVSPFQVHLCVLDIKDQPIMEWVEKMERDCEQAGIEILVDDRDERPGVKFKDADLLGFPYRINLGKKNYEKGMVEIIHRKTKEKVELPPQNAINYLKEKILCSLRTSENEKP